MAKPRAIVITGCDAGYFPLAEDLVASFRAAVGGDCALGFIRFCDTPAPEAIAGAVDHVHDESDDFAEFRKEQGFYVAATAVKARLPEVFPGYDVYCWIDADCWVQDRVTVDKLVAQAGRYDLCIHPEYDVHYRFHPTPGDRSKLIYRRVYGEAALEERTLRLPMLNAGVYSMRAASPVWKLWEHEMRAMKRRFDAGEASFLCDQIPLHRIVYTKEIGYFPLRATDNWQLYACRPAIDRRRRQIVVPTPPHEPIGILHLAGASKDWEMAKTPDGARVRYRYRDAAPYLAAMG